MSSHTGGPFALDACCANAALPPASPALAMPACRSRLRVSAIEPQILTDKLSDVPRFGRPLDAAQHRGREVLALAPARVDDAGHVQRGERDYRIAEPLVRLLDPGVAPETVGDGKPAGEGRERGAREESDDHPAAERVVAQIARLVAPQPGVCLSPRARRGGEEMGGGGGAPPAPGRGAARSRRAPGSGATRGAPRPTGASIQP